VRTERDGLPAGGELVILDAATLATVRTVVLRHSDDLDFENAGAGVPNYLGPAVISPDGRWAWVPSKKDNVKRGTLRSGGNLNFQNTVRAISSRVDLASADSSFGVQIDHDNASLASAGAFDQYGVFLFVALETSREVAVVDAHNRTEFFRINVGRAPQGLALSADGLRLYVSNFMDRSVGVYDLTRLVREGQWQVPLLATLQSVGSERLDATVLRGKQFFYDARDTRLAREGYMSCASCHNDGGYDGRVWDLTGMGEGLRRTIPLNGRAGLAHGFPHWSGNFDEIHDFEGQIRRLAGGTGLMPDADYTQGTRSEPLGDPKAGVSADLDALAAYVGSLTEWARSPFRNADGSLTAAGAAGRAVFQRENCAQCHGGQNFTSSGAATLRDVGTIRQPTSGQRLGGPLAGIDPPTLRDVWAQTSFLHDGSAANLQAAVLAHQGVQLSGGDLASLVAYLQQIDGTEPAPAVNRAPTVTDPGAQTGVTGTAVSLPIAAADPDGDALTYAATGLPAGLAIDSATGLIGGTPTTAGSYTVTVSVSDGRGGTASAAFNWSIIVNPVAPVVTARSPASGATGVSRTANVTATFSSSMDATTVNSATFELRDVTTNAVVPAVVSYDSTRRRATLNPSITLPAGRVFTATLFGGASEPRITDSAGNALAANVSWSFTTIEDTTPPTVSGRSPADGATNVSRTANVTATFNEPMDAATVNGATFELRDTITGALVSAVVTYDPARRRATLDPDVTLMSLRVYQVRLRGGPADPAIKDEAGNRLAEDVLWSFRTR
jgi:mono/diheme cytochrome c family protein